MERDKELAAKLASRVIHGKTILDACEGYLLDDLIVEGKTLRQWGRELKIEIPDGKDGPEALEEVSTKVGTAIQTAESILAIYEMKVSAAASFHDEEYAQIYVRELGGKKKMAAEKIRQITLLDETVDASLAATQAAKAIVEYFKRLVKGLEEVRRGVENRTRLLGLRLRFLSDY